MNETRFLEFEGGYLRCLPYISNMRENTDIEKMKGQLFVKGFCDCLNQKKLFELFSQYGRIVSSKVSINQETGKSLGYGYISYYEEESALSAISQRNQFKLDDGCLLEVLFFKKNSKDNSGTNLFVTNPDSQELMTEENIKRNF